MMWLRRILWILWLACCGLFWLLSGGYAALFLLTASAAVPLLGICWNLAAGRALEAALTLDVIAEKEEPLKGSLAVTNRGVLPGVKVSCRLLCENCFTGETRKETCAVFVGGKGEQILPLAFSCGHCGRIEVSIEEAKAWDIFGLVGLPVKVSEGRAALILPEIYPAEVSFSDRFQEDPEGQEYSMTRRGEDVSETFAVREYRMGDPVKHIHWKLSEKLGAPVVREPGLPVNHSLLLAFDTAVPWEEEASSAEIRDAMGSVTASLGQYFCDNQIAFRLLWYDEEKGESQVEQIAEPGGLAAALSHLLAKGRTHDSMSALEHYRLETGNTEFAHVIAVAASSWPDLAALSDEGRIALLLFSSAFRPEETAQVLRYIEV